jgi:PIN domain nuclease of toxin-antitoxin system
LGVAKELCIVDDFMLPLQYRILSKKLCRDYNYKPAFDRILIASAVSESMSIVSIDQIFRLYDKLKIIR